MPNTREKLIKLLSNAHSISMEAACFEDATYAKQLRMEADHLIANGVTVQKWIPVTERLPEYRKDVLTRSKMGTSGHSFSVAALYMVDNELGWMFYDGFETQDIAEITHWMPLPEPPKGE